MVAASYHENGEKCQGRQGVPKNALIEIEKGAHMTKTRKVATLK
jgi:hypothetical protein